MCDQSNERYGGILSSGTVYRSSKSVWTANIEYIFHLFLALRCIMFCVHGASSYYLHNSVGQLIERFRGVGWVTIHSPPSLLRSRSGRSHARLPVPTRLLQTDIHSFLIVYAAPITLEVVFSFAGKPLRHHAGLEEFWRSRTLSKN